MKRLLIIPLLAAMLLSASGCSMLSDEDRDFYYKGWIKPTDLDKPTPHHAIPTPETGNPPRVVAPAAPNPGAEWSTPPPTY